MKNLRKQDIHIDQWEFEFQQRGEHPLLLADWYCRSFDKYWSQTFGLNLPPYDYIITGLSKGYAPKSLKQQYLAKLSEAIADKAYLDRLLERSIGVMEEFGVFADSLAADATRTLTREELAQRWRDLDAALLPIVPWFWAPFYISDQNMLTDQVKNGLQKHRAQVEKVTNIDTALFVSIFPTREFAFQKEQAALSELVVYAQGHPNYKTEQEFVELQANYLRQFDWLPTFLLMPLRPMTKEQLQVRVADAIANNLPVELAKQQLVKQQNAALAERVLEVVKDDAALVSAIHNARALGYALTTGVEVALQATARCLPFLEQVAKAIGVVFEDIKYLSSAEIIEALETGVPIPQEFFKERKDGYVMMVVGGEQRAVFGKEAAELSQWIDTSLTTPVGEVTELKGQVACKGKVQGRVRVAQQPSDSHKLEPGEILVCPMTNPDYVPAMQRCGAIVTDEGGLLSHAAIMSREFNKPCVIATKIATKVLKDGDVVEVDADAGVVRILK